ncbi:MAG: tRNA-(ms[2]io[6]A)-hydroxylase [Woeseiaceae bacterium]
MGVASLPAPIAEFFDVLTPNEWVCEAVERLPELLHDHANCELKAAGTALGFIYRYPEKAELAYRMSRLAREELRHFEQVRKILEERGIEFAHVSASRYAGTLRRACREKEPERLLDVLLVGALIEARSCERFASLVPHLPDDIGRFYAGLLASEARHFEHYLNFARQQVDIEETAFTERLQQLMTIEAELILSPDSQFRFHSGVPA